MTQAADNISDPATRVSPGYLMAPFGWAARPLAAMLEADRSLHSALFTLSRHRMHLIALALAHWPGEIDACFARLLILGAPRMLFDAVLGRRPFGLKRALGHLPLGVLQKESYRQLVELLEEPATAALIHFADALEDDYIGLLHSVPAPLRRIIGRSASRGLIRPEGFVDGLRFLVVRGAAPSFDVLVADLAAIQQPAQFIARITSLVRRLPLPQFTPPAIIGHARRLDDLDKICQLAKRWNNCLADCYVDAVNDGRSAVYLWPDAQAPAACVVTRHGRLGWGLEAAKGPKNVELPPRRLEEICSAFAAANIPKEALEALEHAARTSSSLHWHQMRRRRRRDADYEERYEDVEAFEAALG
jgi:hypothetical protein